MIDKIKTHFPIQIIAAQACGGLRPSSKDGRYYLGYCPFCQNGQARHTRPKFWVDTKLQLCNCFKPRCKLPQPMDVINLYARLHQIDNDLAITELHFDRMVGNKPKLTR